jgi:RHS repeat-associated protein
MACTSTYRISWTACFANGTVIYEQHFDAWGKRRNADSWEYANVVLDPDFSWVRGFTGHEHHDEFGIINMNNRMYDPVIARMMGADNYVQSPYFSQSYNRYSYVWNNPMSYTDPSGDVAWVAAGIGFVVGAYLGGSVANNSYNPAQWSFESGNGLGRTIAGMTIGGILGGLGGWNVGTAMAAKAAAPTAGNATVSHLTADLFSGFMNAMYSYDADNGLGLHTLAHFGAGFLGASTGNSLGMVQGLIVGGAANVAAHVGSYDGQGGSIGYQVAQKFVGGALTTFAGVDIHKKSLSYLSGVKQKYLFGKGWAHKGISYGIQNYAQTFAYTSQDKFLDMSAWKHFGLIGSGFVSGVGNYGVEKINFGNFWANAGVRTVAGFVNFGLIDYSLNHAILYGNYYGGPIQYSGLGQKTRIGTLKNMFMHLFIGDGKLYK